MRACEIKRVRADLYGSPCMTTIIEITHILSKAFTAGQSGGEQTKKVKFDLSPLASSTMYVNTLRPRITIVTSFVWA